MLGYAGDARFDEVEIIAKAAFRARDVRLDGADRDVQRLRDLAVTKTGEVVELERLTVFLRKRGERGMHPAGLVVTNGDVFRSEIVRDPVEFERRDTFAAAKRIERGVPRDYEEPAGEGTIGMIRFEPAERAQERVLSDVVRLVEVVRHLKGEADDRCAVAVDELVEGRKRAATSEFDERGVEIDREHQRQLTGAASALDRPRRSKYSPSRKTTGDAIALRNQTTKDGRGSRERGFMG